MTASDRRGPTGMPFLATVPVTVVFLTVTAVVSIAALTSPELSSALVRNASLVREGQWWRLVTPLLVQPAGWGQLAFNLLGIAVVGAAFERRSPWGHWVVTFLAAGIGSVVVLALLRPEDHGGGSSDGVAGLIGALAVASVLDGTRREGPARVGSRCALETVSTAYSAFFCAYLAVLHLGVWPAIVAGDLALAVAITARLRLDERRTAIAVLVLVMIAGVAMAVQVDGHGVGLLVGGVSAVIARRSVVRAPGR